MRISNAGQGLNDNLMSHLSIARPIGFSIILLTCLSLTAGCSNERSASRYLEITTARAQANTIIHDTQAELTALRRDLAAARIATSKQEGEAAELRRKTSVLETDRAELRKMLEQAHSTVTTLQAEQDALKQTLAQAQTVHLLRQESSAPSKPNVIDVQADLNELRARMMTLTDELAQLKQRFSTKPRVTTARPRRESAEHFAEASPKHVARDEAFLPRILPSPAFLASPEQATRPSRALDRALQPDSIRVQPGDSLWKLAHDHATTIEELKRINGLTSDVVHAGRRLILPSSGVPDDHCCSLASRPSNPDN